MKKELNRYCRRISRYLPMKKAQRQQIIEQIRHSAEDYQAEHPAVDMSALIAHFGTPQEIAASYVENMTPEEILKKFRIRRTVLIVICSVVAAAFLMWTAVVGSALMNELNAAGGFVVVEPVVEVE